MYQVYLTTNSKSIKVVIGTAFMGRCSCGTAVWFANIRKQAKDHKSLYAIDIYCVSAIITVEITFVIL
jgi:hypothetical protein